jgi:hypothetical protein
MDENTFILQTSYAIFFLPDHQVFSFQIIQSTGQGFRHAHRRKVARSFSGSVQK